MSLSEADAAGNSRGHYFGTEIDEKWWRRYSKDNLLARGIGEYWMDEEAFHFRRYLTKTPIVIRFQAILEIKIGKWHSGKWGHGASIVKIVWNKDGMHLCCV